MGDKGGGNCETDLKQQRGATNREGAGHVEWESRTETQRPGGTFREKQRETESHRYNLEAGGQILDWDKEQRRKPSGRGRETKRVSEREREGDTPKRARTRSDVLCAKY